MIRRSIPLLGLLAWVAALTGCPVPPVISLKTIGPAQLPREPAALERLAHEYELKNDPVSLENCLVVRDRQLELDRRNYEVLWHASRVAFLLADEAIGDAAKGTRRHFAQAGVDYAKQAMVVEPNRVEGTYYYAVNLGLLATTKTVGALLALPDLQRHAEAAIRLDETFDHAGPRRLLGAAKLKAPPQPASIGDPEEGCEHLQRAVQIAPGYPANHLYYCEALIANDRRDEARRECEVVLAAPPNPEWTRDLPRWRAEAERLLQRINK